MNYRLKLFINSIVDMYSDIMVVDLTTRQCKYIYVENGMVEELEVPYSWEEAKVLLLSNIHSDDRQKVLDAWNQHMTAEAEPDSAFAITYRSMAGERGRAASQWKMNIAIQESNGRKIAIIFSRDHSMEMKEKLHLGAEVHKDHLTSLYNHFKLNEMINTEYSNMDSCGVLYFDINDFRSIKEVYGEKEEEEILSHIAESIHVLENPKVLAYRYDKDDFLVIARDYSKDAFRNLINFWVDRWKNLCEGRPVEYTVALGNAWDCAPDAVREPIAKAEGHMFRNKKLMKSGIPMDYYLQDEITSSYGLFSGSQFFKTVDYRLKNEAKDYCLIAIDIEHFKVYNKWWGRKAGDEFLADIATVLKEYEDKYDGVASYIGGDNFAILLPAKQEIPDSLTQTLSQLANEKTSNVGFLPAIGVYCTSMGKMDAMIMYDRATEAQAHVFGNYEKRCCVYEESMTKEVEQELNLIIEAKEALERRQFFLVLQPKCRINTGKIVGAEALVRWRHPSKGMISPGAFIPVLEKNGFITDLDLFVWEEVCRKIRETSDIPVIFLTARGEEFDELECFECGADDFISKPFSPSVLVKRIEARLKRSAGDGGIEKISLDGLVIDVVAHEVTCNGKPVELTHKEYCILHKLAANKDRVFSREQLLDDIWGFDFLGDSRTVDSHVARLRTKLGEWGSKHLRTVYGAGYKIEVN